MPDRSKDAAGADAFPPLINLRAAGWSEPRVQALEAICAVNNPIAAQAALARVDLADHVYSFATWCDLRAPRQP